MSKFAIVFLSGILCWNPSLFANGTATKQLPKGVRAFVYHHVWAQLAGSFDESGNPGSLGINERLNGDKIGQLSSEAQQLIFQVQNLDPQILDGLDVGYVELEPKVNVQGEVFGLAVGVTDRVMFFAGVPVIRASVQLEGGYVPTASLHKTVQLLRQRAADPNYAENKDLYLSLAQFFEQLPSVSGEALQGLVVNDLNYKPVGNWSGYGIGDAQVFSHIKLFDSFFNKHALRVGLELPTGRTDDPDNLVDIPFGTGHYSNYLESCNDFDVFQNESLILNATSRYTLKWATYRTYRVPTSPDFPLSANSERVYWKPGNKFDLSAAADFRVYGPLRGLVDYAYAYKDKDLHRGPTPGYDYSILSAKTNWESFTLTTGLVFSSVAMFAQKKFPFPFKGGLFYIDTLGGFNTERVQMARLETEFYF